MGATLLATADIARGTRRAVAACVACRNARADSIQHLPIQDLDLTCVRAKFGGWRRAGVGTGASYVNVDTALSTTVVIAALLATADVARGTRRALATCVACPSARADSI